MKKDIIKQNFRRRISWFLLGVATATTINTFTSPQQPEPAMAEAIQEEPTTEIAYITDQTPTVWDLANAEFPGENTAAMVYEISQLNPGIELDRVKKGQAITIPTK